MAANEEKIGLKDVISLALKGWSKEDIKELVNIANAAEAGKPDEEPQKGTGEEPAPADPGEPPEPEKGTDPKEAEDAIDYKKLYEDSQAELAKAQAANRSKDTAPDPAQPMKDLKAAISSYM